MKKAILALLLSFMITGCSAITDNPPKPMQVDTPSNDTTGIKNEEPTPEPTSEDEIPIYLDEIPIILTILEPDSIGNVYVEATYTNNTEYPIVSYSLNVLLKDTNEKAYLSNHDTILPGETSPKFKGSGPDSGNIDDIQKLKLSITALTENNKKLYLDYDLKIDWVEWFYEQ